MRSTTEQLKDKDSCFFKLMNFQVLGGTVRRWYVSSRIVINDLMLFFFFTERETVIEIKWCCKYVYFYFCDNTAGNHGLNIINVNIYWNANGVEIDKVKVILCFIY